MGLTANFRPRSGNPDAGRHFGTFRGLSRAVRRVRIGGCLVALDFATGGCRRSRLDRRRVGTRRDRPGHLVLQERQSRPGQGPVALVRFQAVRRHRLHEPNALGKLRIVTAVALGVLLLADVSNPPEYPFSRSDTNLRTSPFGL